MEDHAWWTTLKIDGRREAILSQSQRSIYKEMLILGLLRYHFFACGACNANVTVGYLTYSLVFLFWGARGPGSQNRRGGAVAWMAYSIVVPHCLSMVSCPGSAVRSNTTCKKRYMDVNFHVHPPQLGEGPMCNIMRIEIKWMHNLPQAAVALFVY